MAENCICNKRLNVDHLFISSELNKKKAKIYIVAALATPAGLKTLRHWGKINSNQVQCLFCWWKMCVPWHIRYGVFTLWSCWQVDNNSNLCSQRLIYYHKWNPPRLQPKSWFWFGVIGWVQTARTASVGTFGPGWRGKCKAVVRTVGDGMEID